MSARDTVDSDKLSLFAIDLSDEFDINIKFQRNRFRSQTKESSKKNKVVNSIIYLVKWKLFFNKKFPVFVLWIVNLVLEKYLLIDVLN